MGLGDFFLLLAFPRIRGGDPAKIRVESKDAMLFPAYAGVIPSPDSRLQIPESFPRIRGGDPLRKEEAGQRPGFSPHTRG